MIVCLCHRVSDRDIVQAVRDGTHSFELLQAQTLVATSCGSCRDCARQVFDDARARCSPLAVSGVVLRGPQPSPA